MRFIDADALLQELRYKPYLDYADIKSQPTADVVEVKHGHWIEHIVKPDWLEDDVEVYYNCSECGTSHWSITPPYCPECGAKMDGEMRTNYEKV